MLPVIERKHRLPRESYKGAISVAFTLCLKNAGKLSGFIPRHKEMVDQFIEILTAVSEETCCFVPAYCFMPDHQHLIVTGRESGSDLWKMVTRYKQKTGYWLSKNGSLRWQKDFYDHLLGRGEDLAAQVKYILDNPVRKGLLESWEEYPFKGSVGCKLEDVLRGII
jgi:putative transposase